MHAIAVATFFDVEAKSQARRRPIRTSPASRTSTATPRGAPSGGVRRGPLDAECALRRASRRRAGRGMPRGLPVGCLGAACHPCGQAGTVAEGHTSASRHVPQRGARAVHTARPWRMSLRLSAPHCADGTRAPNSRSTTSGSGDVVKPSRRASRPTWVSTGSPGSLNATLRTTFAVLRPTPGRVTRSSIAEGTWPSKRSTSVRAIPSRLLAFERKNPVERISSSSASGSAPANDGASG